MPYEFTPLVLPYAVALAVTAVLWRRLWRHRNRRAAKGFLLDVTGVVLLSAVLILKLTATDVATKLFWWNWRFLAVSFMSIGYMLMAVEYTDNEDLIDRRVGAGLVVVVVLTQVAAWTNGRDGLLYSSGDLQNGLLVPSFGPLYWVYAFLMVSCIVVGVSLLVNLFRARDGFRVQTAVLVGTVTLVMTGVVLWWGGVIPIDVLALTSTVKVVGFYVAVDRLQLLEALPVARTTVFQNMEDAVFVLNERGQVVDVNPAAKSLVDDRNVTGESIDDALAVDVAADVVAASTGSAASDALENRQIALECDSGMRYYGLKLSQFSDGTGVVAVFRDVTERRNREQEITVLNRIVRHDIRNEMNVLHGRGQLVNYPTLLAPSRLGPVGHSLRVGLFPHHNCTPAPVRGCGPASFYRPRAGQWVGVGAATHSYRTRPVDCPADLIPGGPLSRVWGALESHHRSQFTDGSYRP